MCDGVSASFALHEAQLGFATAFGKAPGRVGRRPARRGWLGPVGKSEIDQADRRSPADRPHLSFRDFFSCSLENLGANELIVFLLAIFPLAKRWN